MGTRSLTTFEEEDGTEICVHITAISCYDGIMYSGEIGGYLHAFEKWSEANEE